MVVFAQRLCFPDGIINYYSSYLTCLCVDNNQRQYRKVVGLELRMLRSYIIGKTLRSNWPTLLSFCSFYTTLIHCDF